MSKLSNRYICPPFSVIDRRTGNWQRQRQKWADLGLFSAEGRPGGITYGGPMMSDPKYLDKYDACCERLGRKITKKEFNEQYYDGDLKGYTSRFDPLLAELAYKWFCPPSGKILDPFAGGPARGCVAELLGYCYTGVDLYSNQVETDRKRAEELNISPTWICGDSRVEIAKLEDESYDFIFSCPPYWNVEDYGDDARELASCETYSQFAEDYSAIIDDCVKKLKQGRFAAFEVGDVRLPDGHYAGLPTTTVQAFENAGAGLYNTMIVLDPAGTAALRCQKQFNASRKVVRTHQELLVFYKGDPRLIRCNELTGELGEPAMSAKEYWEELL